MISMCVFAGCEFCIVRILVCCAVNNAMHITETSAYPESVRTPSRCKQSAVMPCKKEIKVFTPSLKPKANRIIMSSSIFGSTHSSLPHPYQDCMAYTRSVSGAPSALHHSIDCDRHAADTADSYCSLHFLIPGPDWDCILSDYSVSDDSRPDT